jgi:hypothetical protein
LLDQFNPNWRDAVRTNRDIGALLAQAIHFQHPRNLDASAHARAKEYGWDEVDKTEAARDSARAPVMQDYRARFGSGPIITLRQSKDSLAWSYDPTELIGFDLRSTVYPSGNFSAPWGKLTVEHSGVLVENDFSRIRIGARTTPVAANPSEIKGDGWTLALNPGWSLRADSLRAGSFIATRDR